jgi:hypothetical protein
MVGEKFYSTMDSVADESNSSVKESIVFKHFLLVLYFDQSWNILYNICGVGVYKTSQTL